MQKPHSNPDRERFDRRQIAWPLALGSVLLLVLVLMPLPAPRGGWPPAGRKTDDHAPPSRTAPSSSTGPPAGDAVAGQADQREELPPQPAPHRRTFAEFVAELVRLGLATARGIAVNDLAAAEASDREARRVFEELLQQVPDLGPPALALYLEQPAEATDDAVRIRQTIARLCLEAALPAMHAATGQGQDRDGLDAFVSAMLAAMPGGAHIGRDLGKGLLVDKPYLGAAHEAMLLDLCRLAAEGRFAVDIAAALLTTLWRNLEAAGIRDRSQLASLALLMLQGGTPSETLAACRTLLLDPRYRDLVLDYIENKKDRGLAETVAMAAADGLAAEAALPVIKSMHTLTANVTAALIKLGMREPAALQKAYELALADGVAPEFRSELVSGAGFGAEPAGIELARLALQNDPVRGVRERAMFVLTARAAAAWGEQAITCLLDDAAFASDPNHLAAAVSALTNLERAGLVNAIDRLGQRLLGLPLRATDRESLLQLLERALPRGGEPSRSGR